MQGCPGRHGQGRAGRLVPDMSLFWGLRAAGPCVCVPPAALGLSSVPLFGLILAVWDAKAGLRLHETPSTRRCLENALVPRAGVLLSPPGTAVGTRALAQEGCAVGTGVFLGFTPKV